MIESSSTSAHALRWLPARLVTFALTAWLCAGCDAVLDLEKRPLIDDEKTQGGPASDDAPEPCKDRDLRCDDGTQRRSLCDKGTWKESPCPEGTQCNSMDPKNCAPEGTMDQPCKTPGALACAAAASVERSLCDPDSMTFVAAPSCKPGETCDRTDGECRPILPACMGHAPGDVVCDGAMRLVCGQDLTTASKQEKCESAAHCTEATGIACAVCLKGEHSCAGAELSECNEARDAFTAKQTCPSAALCNEEAGACTSAACVEGQTRCEGDALLTCNADHTGFDAKAACDPGRCNQAAGRCDACAQNSCEDDAMRLVCSDDRAEVTREACPRDRSHCIGDGNCVQCRMPDDCATPNECQTVACSGNRCEVGNRTAGRACARETGACDGNGNCVPRQPPVLYSVDPRSGFPGFALDTRVRGEHLGGATALEFIGAPDLRIERDRASATELRVTIHIAEGAGPASYALAVTTPGGMATLPDAFEVRYQPLAAIRPMSARIGARVEIQAKMDSTIHDPALAAPPLPGAPPVLATGTTAFISEDGEIAMLEPHVVTPAANQRPQVISVEIPPLQGRWSDRERVTIVVEYTDGTHGEIEFVYQP